jgi:hypothetical protein
VKPHILKHAVEKDAPLSRRPPQAEAEARFSPRRRKHNGQSETRLETP